MKMENVFFKRNSLYWAASIFLTYKIYTHLNKDKKYLLYYNCVRRLLNKILGIQEIEEIVDYEFFNSENLNCRKHIINNKACSLPYCSVYKLQRIINFLQSATSSVDLCIFLLTSKEIEETLISLHKKGIKVRVIVEEEMCTSSESRIQHLIHAGIVVRSKKLPVLMHNKFCLIDAEIRTNCKVLTGSLNWTLQGFAGNSEYIIILNNEYVIREFFESFNSIWNYFDVKEKKVIVRRNSRLRYHR